MSIGEIVEQIKVWPPKKKFTLFLAAGLSIALMAGIIAWSNRIDYQILYSNITQEDASQAVAKLSEMRVPHRVEGNAIYVPGDRLYELRLQLATHGIPQGGGVGFEIFDKPQIGVSEFVQKLNYRRALQGELARTIMRLVEVDQCRVHIAIPEKSLFAEEEETTTASVVIKLKPGRVLNRNQIGGIVHLVSSSVEGLAPESVAVIDEKGALLSKPESGKEAMAEKQLEYQKFVNKYYEDKLQSMLDGIVGKNNAIVRVSTTIDYTSAERTEETFNPDSIAVKTEERFQEKSTGTLQGGIPGVLSNEPGQTPVTSANASEAQNQKEKVDYEVSKSVSRVIKSRGEVKKISVAVVVNGTYKDEGGQSVYVPRSGEELKKYEDIIKVAIGYDEARGDQVILENAPFESAAPSLPFEEPGFVKTALAYVVSSLKYLIPIFVGIFLIIFVIRPVVESFKKPFPVAGSGTARLSGVHPPGVLPPERSLKEQVEELVQKDPRQAALILKDWLSE